jgi:hypothetical protein
VTQILLDLLVKDKPRQEDNSKMDIGEVTVNGSIMNTKMNFWVKFKAGNFVTIHLSPCFIVIQID